MRQFIMGVVGVVVGHCIWEFIKYGFYDKDL